MKIIKENGPGNSVDHYREDWFTGNDKIFTALRESTPVPYGRLLWPRYCSEVRRRGTGWFRFENTPELTFEYLFEGTLSYTQNGVSERVNPGEIYIMHPGNDIVFHAGPKDFFHRYRIMFCGTLAHELDLELGLNRRNVCRLANPEPFLAGIRAIAERMLADDPADAAELSAMTYTLITGFAAELSRGRELDVPEPLGRIVRGIRANPSGEKPVRRLAEENGMEIHMLMRLFRKHLGVSPLEYRNRLRIEEAKRHLAHSTLSMKEIAERLGYRNALYFSTAFRKRTGVSPSLYRKRSRETLE